MKNKCSNCETENDINSKYCSMCGYELPVVENKIKSEFKEQEIKPKTKRKIDLKTSLGFAIGFAIVFYFTQSLFAPTIDKQLVQFADEINKTCPLSVDQYTTLKNVAILPNKTVQYNYILVNNTKAEVKLDTVKKYIFPTLLQNVKTNPGMKIFRDSKVTLVYSYNDKNGVFVTDYKIKPEMYQ